MPNTAGAMVEKVSRTPFIIKLDTGKAEGYVSSVIVDLPRAI